MEHSVMFVIKKILRWEKFPLILAIFLYSLIYFLRLQQGGWDIKTNFFSEQRKILDQKIEKLLPSPQAELLSGILLGIKEDLPPHFRLALRDTATLHIVVVSGQNLSLVAGFFLILSGFIKRKLAISLAFISIIFYTLLTGAEIPVLRATVMVTLAFWAQILGRQQDSIWVLSLAAALMLLINPEWILDLSFQLSFMATLGLVIVAPLLVNYFKRIPLLGQDLAVTIGAQIMVMPIIMQNFHQLSLVGIFANLLVGWTVPFVMILGVILLILSFLSQILAQIVALVIKVLLTYFIYVVQFFASLPFAWEYIGEQVWVVWVGYYLIVLAVLLLIYDQTKVRE